MPIKTRDEILEDILTRLRTQGGITETSPGGIARMFAEVITDEFKSFYEELNTVSLMGFVTTSTGSYLDLIGQLLNCKREDFESDDNYKARIVNQVTVMQSANLIALRFKALSVNGVADVQFKRYTKGAGSFTCYVIPEEYPIKKEVLVQVEDVLNETAAYGMTIEVKVSEFLPVDMVVNMIFNSRTTSLEKQHLRNKAAISVEGYMKELNRGMPIIINEITQRIMDVSDQVLDMEIKELSINGKQVFVKNIIPSSEQQYYLRNISIT